MSSHDPLIPQPDEPAAPLDWHRPAVAQSNPTPAQDPRHWAAPPPLQPGYSYGHSPVPAPPSVRTRPSLLTTAIVGLAAGLLGVGVGSAANTQGLLPPVTTPSVSDAGLRGEARPGVEGVLDSVFTIAVARANERGSGSGVAIDSTHIVTNAHVVTLGTEDASTPRIEVQDALGREYAATVVGVDEVADVAVLEVKGLQATPIEWGDSSELTVGQPVAAVGAPLGLSNTVTSGIVSSLNRPVELSKGVVDPAATDAATFINAIQTDAAINSGNSGGALIDAEGRLVGLNVAISVAGDSTGNIGIGYAIPSSYVKRVSEELIAEGRASHGFLGISVGTRGSKGGSFQDGALVQEITPAGPAAKSPLRKGDTVVAWDGAPVASANSLVAFVKSAAPGEKVTLTVVRGLRERAVEVTLGSDKG